MKTEEILEKIEEFNMYNGDGIRIRNFISSLDLTPEQMELLAEHENEYVKCELVKNPNLTKELMIKLSSDEDWRVRWGLTRNPNLTSKKVMIKLSNDGDDEVRYGLAQHPKLPKDLIYKLSEDEDVGVRRKIYERTNLSEDLIIRLGCDVYVHTKARALQRLNKLHILKLEELESAYDLIMKSKYISRKNFEETFDYIADEFSELSELAEMFKRIILKGKKDLK